MITARGLARRFRTKAGDVEAVRGVDLDVADGEIVGFLGPNGAGKTTTLRMLTTLLAPTAGEATVAGCDLRADPVGVRARIGYVAQSGGTDPACRVREELEQQGAFYRLPAATARERAGQLLERLDLAGLDRRECKSLSGGQRRRLDIALGLVHDPRLVFLDEPTTGLDPQARANLWEHIRGLRSSSGTTVFLTTHYLDEADALCDRILVIDAGQIVAEGSPDELKRRISGDVVTAEVAGGAAQAEQAKKVLEDQADASGEIRDVQVSGSGLRVGAEHGERALLAIMRILDAASVELASISLSRPSLDDVFLTLTGRSLRDAEAPAPHEGDDDAHAA